MKKLLLLSLLSIAGGAYAMEQTEPIEPAIAQSQDTLSLSLFKKAVLKTLTTDKAKTLASLDKLLQETKNNPAQAPEFIKEQLKEHFAGMKVNDLKEYKQLHALYSQPREAQKASFSQTFIHPKNGQSYTIDKPKSESDYESARVIFRDQHISADPCYLPFRILFRSLNNISLALDTMRTDMGYPRQGFDEDTSRIFLGWITKGKYECNVLRDNSRSEVIGFVTYRAEVDKTYIGDICVDEKYRGHGFGKALIESVIAHEKPLGVKKIYLTSDPKPVEFYKHIGMTQNGTEYFGLGSQPIFEKDIA